MGGGEGPGGQIHSDSSAYLAYVSYQHMALRGLKLWISRHAKKLAIQVCEAHFNCFCFVPNYCPSLMLLTLSFHLLCPITTLFFYMSTTQVQQTP